MDYPVGDVLTNRAIAVVPHTVDSFGKASPQGKANPVIVASGTDYEAVAASQVDQIMGTTGAAGDYLAGVLIQPGTTSPGSVVVKDGNTTVYTFPGGADSVGTLHPFFVPIGARCINAGWKITTGANVTALGLGSFT